MTEAIIKINVWFPSGRLFSLGTRFPSTKKLSTIGKDRDVACDDCSKWYHAECLHMSIPVYNAFASSNISWHWVTCGMPNFSSSLFESFIVNTLNRFDQLSNSNVSCDSGPTSVQSSPIKSNRTNRNNQKYRGISY